MVVYRVVFVRREGKEKGKDGLGEEMIMGLKEERGFLPLGERKGGCRGRE